MDARRIMMIKAELSYNPYLLETLIRFNNQSPRINSQVEKFQEGSLQNWVKKIPQIFYDEMNGYDFELEFSGTKVDFQEIMDAFTAIGVTEQQVHIFHKNELSERKVKVEQIRACLEWLEDHPNRNFDFVNFREVNSNLFDNSYTYIIFQNQIFDSPELRSEGISAEYVSKVEELENTDLYNTPVLFYISEENYLEFQQNLRELLGREDVAEEQIFFLMHPSLDKNKTERIIQDLGVDGPQIVSKVNDNAIKKYMELYPVSEYIYKTIRVFRRYTDEIMEYLTKENQRSEIMNKEIHEQIEKLEANLQRLKRSLEQFLNRDNIEIPTTWMKAESELLYELNNWRKKKTKICNDGEAYEVAMDFEQDIQKYFGIFQDTLRSAVENTKASIDSQYSFWYKEADVDPFFSVNDIELNMPVIPGIQIVYDELLKLREEEYIQSKEDFLGKLFKVSQEETTGQVLVRTYYYQNWRNYVVSIVTPIEEKLIQDYFDSIKEYEMKIAQIYVNHLEELIGQQSREKDLVSSQLSEERILQNDNDWLAELQDQLKVIERG